VGGALSRQLENAAMMEVQEGFGGIRLTPPPPEELHGKSGQSIRSTDAQARGGPNDLPERKLSLKRRGASDPGSDAASSVESSAAKRPRPGSSPDTGAQLLGTSAPAVMSGFWDDSR
jgi:hypothetical protein